MQPFSIRSIIFNAGGPVRVDDSAIRAQMNDLTEDRGFHPSHAADSPAPASPPDEETKLVQRARDDRDDVPNSVESRVGDPGWIRDYPARAWSTSDRSRDGSSRAAFSIQRCL